MKARKARFGLTLLAAVAATVPLAAPGHAADATTVTVGTPTVSGSTVSVSGSIDFGTDVTGERIVSTDAPADATVKGVGLDLETLSVRTDLAAKKLIWTLTVGDAPAAIGGSPPATGYLVPIMADGDERWRWLAAGTVGSNQGKTANWTGLCHNEQTEGTQGAWSCPTTTAGSMTATKVTWTQRFTEMKPALAFGSVVEPSSIHGGVPASMLWPAAFITAGLAPVDTMNAMEAFKIPGQVQLAIAKTGTTPAPSAFSHAATFNGATKGFSGSVPTPTATGDYTVWAQTCFGDGYEPICVRGSAGGITI